MTKSKNNKNKSKSRSRSSSTKFNGKRQAGTQNSTDTTAPARSEKRSIEDLPRSALEAIFDELDSSEIAGCTLVCKAWRSIFTEPLWSGLVISQNRLEGDYLGPEFKQALLKNGHHIRALCVTYYAPLKVFFVKDDRSQHSGTVTTSHPTHSSTPLTFVSMGSSSSSSGRTTGASRAVVCPKLETLILKNVPEFDLLGRCLNLDEMAGPFDETVLVRFLQQVSSTLRILYMDPFPCSRANFVRVITDYLPRLEQLCLISMNILFSDYIDPAELRRFLLHCPPHIERLTLRVDIFGENEETGPMGPPPKYFAYRPDLFPVGQVANSSSNELTMRVDKLEIRDLVLGGSFCFKQGEQMLCAFLRRCPKLERLCLKDPSLRMFNELASTLRGHCPLLDKLEIGECCRLDKDEELSTVLTSTTKGWKLFSMLGIRHQFGRLSTAVLERHFNTLESLKLSKTAHLPSRSAVRLLTTARNLKDLDLLGTMPFVFCPMTNTTLYSRDLLTESSGNDVPGSFPGLTDRSSPMRVNPWKCLNLVTLRIKIAHIPRLDLLLPEESRGLDDLPAYVYGIELQRQILAQIGRLIHLEELSFGNFEDEMLSLVGLTREGTPVIDPEYHHLDCLSLSLKHGLNELRNLKKLRVLDVSHMTHMIHERELSWMKVHWGKLTTIHGMEPLGFILPSKETVRWLSSNRSDWVDKDQLQNWRAAYGM